MYINSLSQYCIVDILSWTIPAVAGWSDRPARCRQLYCDRYIVDCKLLIYRPVTVMCYSTSCKAVSYRPGTYKYSVAMVTTIATGYSNCLVTNDPLGQFPRSLQYIAVNTYTILTHTTLHHLPIIYKSFIL